MVITNSHAISQSALRIRGVDFIPEVHGNITLQSFLLKTSVIIAGTGLLSRSCPNARTNSSELQTDVKYKLMSVTRFFL